jgi:hypothetical protein
MGDTGNGYALYVSFIPQVEILRKEIFLFFKNKQHAKVAE